MLRTGTGTDTSTHQAHLTDTIAAEIPKPKDRPTQPVPLTVTTAENLKPSAKAPPAKKAGKTVLKKRTNRRKDKNYPKRPLSAYNYFFKEERQRILAILEEREGAVNDPESKNYISQETIEKLMDKKGFVVFPEMAKLIGSHWKNVDTAEGERLRILAKEDLKRYNHQMQLYQVQVLNPEPSTEYENRLDGSHLGGYYGMNIPVQPVRPIPHYHASVPMQQHGYHHVTAASGVSHHHGNHGGLYRSQGPSPAVHFDGSHQVGHSVHIGAYYSSSAGASSSFGSDTVEDPNMWRKEVSHGRSPMSYPAQPQSQMHAYHNYNARPAVHYGAVMDVNENVPRKSEGFRNAYPAF